MVADAPSAAGVAPYLPLLPLVTDRHVGALTLSGTITEVTDHVVALLGTGIDGIIIRPFAPKRGTIEETIALLSAACRSRISPREMRPSQRRPSRFGTSSASRPEGIAGLKTERIAEPAVVDRGERLLARACAF